MQTDPAFTIFEVLRCGKTQIKFAFALGLIAIFDFVLDTSPRQSTNKFVFALGPIPIFDFVLDTPPRQNTNKFAFALGLIPIFDFVLDTPPRQSTNKFVFALGNRIFAEDRRRFGNLYVLVNSCDCHHLIIFAKTIPSGRSVDKMPESD